VSCGLLMRVCLRRACKHVRAVVCTRVLWNGVQGHAVGQCARPLYSAWKSLSMTAQCTHAAHPRHTQRGCFTRGEPRVPERARPARQGAVAAYKAAAELAPDVAAHPANVAAAALMQARARGPAGLEGCEAAAAGPAACRASGLQAGGGAAAPCAGSGSAGPVKTSA